MRRTLACLLVAAFALAVPALGAGKKLDEGTASPARPVTGFVEKWDDAEQSFTLRMGDGVHRVQFLLTPETRLMPKPAIGDRVTVRYRRESPTRLVAEIVLVRPQASQEKK